MKQKKFLCAGCAAMLLLSVVLLLCGNEMQYPVLKIYKEERCLKVSNETALEPEFVVEEEIEQPDFSFQLKYKQYPMTYTYVVCETQGINIRKFPSPDAKVLREAGKWEKLQYIETVRFLNHKKEENENSQEQATWYHVYWYENSEQTVVADGSDILDGNGEKTGLKKVFGFVNANVVSKRSFAFSKMQEKIKQLEDEMREGSITYVSNYKNYHGKAPLCGGKEKDEGGTPRSQSAPAYLSATKASKFIYVPDGTLVKSIEQSNGFWHVTLVQNGKQYFIPENYIERKEALKVLSKIIVIDRKNQNIACFEKNEGTWEMVSYSLVTTGTTNAYAQPTPLGCYFVIQKRPQFWYYKDGTTEIQGYAPYTLRFCGGAYLHGVSVSYLWKNGNRVDPGLREFSSSIGTIPLSHKCVRNYTSHAKFLYDWYTKDETVVLVIEP